jgi:hypothetical protein
MARACFVDDRLLKIVLVGRLYRAKQKEVVTGWGGKMSQGKIKGKWDFPGRVQNKMLNRLGWRRSVHS